MCKKYLQVHEHEDNVQAMYRLERNEMTDETPTLQRKMTRDRSEIPQTTEVSTYLNEICELGQGLS